jgi:energy-coupling factor transport system ATP-binding protein
LPGDGTAVHGPPAEVLARCPVVPPVVELGRRFGWQPLPLTVRQARAAATGLRDRLPAAPALPDRPRPGPATAEVHRLVVSYGRHPALRSVDLTVRSGEIVALMGRNGSGKSTLLRALTGLVRPAGGEVRVAGADPRELRGRSLPRAVGLVPQRPADLLYAETVAGECALADREGGLPPGTAAAVLRRIAGPLDPDTHPGDLSEGQRLSLALAVVLASAPPLLLLDEPTRGLDYAAKARLAAALTEQARRGTALVLATHDVELAAEISDRAVVLADGDVVADGPSREVVTSSPVFAPQVAKVLAPLPYLTVADVTRTTAAAEAGR